MNINLPISTRTSSNLVTADLKHGDGCMCRDCTVKRLHARIESLESALARIGYIAAMSKSPANLFAERAPALPATEAPGEGETK